MTKLALANLAMELILSGASLMAKLDARQKERDAEGRELTQAEILELMNRHDTQEALTRAKLATAELSRLQSLQ